MISDDYRRDIEESNETLEYTEGDPINFWEKKQKDVVTSTVDYNLTTLTDLVRSESIDLKPQYQRRDRWDKSRQSKLIESFLMNVPVPPIFLNEDEYGQYSVIDGKQRLTAIFEFIRGRLTLQDLEIFSDVNGMTIDNLPKNLQNVIKTRPTLRAIIILRQSDRDVKFEVFKRLNTGGMRCNDREIRNSAYTGRLNNLILELSQYKKFHSLLGIKSKEKSAIYKEMKDAELVLRYFTFKDIWQQFPGAVKRNMDKYMSDNQHISKEQAENLKTDFLNTIDTVEACFGTHAFNRWIPESNKWKNQLLAALYDAQMFACMALDKEKANSKRSKIISNLQQLFEDREFRKHIDSATNGITAFRRRIEIMKSMLEESLAEE